MIFQFQIMNKQKIFKQKATKKMQILLFKSQKQYSKINKRNHHLFAQLIKNTQLMTSTSFIQELFKERQLHPFKPTQQQQQIGKQSLIYKKKCNANIHSLLFCKLFSSAPSEISTLNQKKILEDEKHKYFDYVRKTFKQKLPEDFENENKLKKALKNKIIEKRQNEAAKNQQEPFKRPRAPVQAIKDKKPKQKEQNGNKKLKKAEQSKEKKIVADQQASNEVFDEDNFESEVSLENDEVEGSYENDYDQN